MTGAGEVPDRATLDNGTSRGAIGGPDWLSCEVYETFEGLDHLREEWDEAVLRAGGSIYMTYDWVRVWWEFYGQGADLRLFVFRVEGRIEGIVPIYIDTLGWRPLRFRVARLVGANIPPKVFDPPVPAGFAAATFEHVLQHLFLRDKCDLASLGPISEVHHSAESLATLCRTRTDLAGGWSVDYGVHSVFHIPGDMEEYYAALSKNERKHRRKYDLRLLGKDCQVRVEVLNGCAEAPGEFERFAEQHRLQWAAEGKPGHFGAWPRALEFNRALVAAQARQGRLRLIRIVADERAVARELVFAHGERWHWELPAREVGPDWDRYSLGPSGIVTMIALGLGEGVKRIEAGLGHYGYKVRLGAKEYRTQTLRIVSRRYSSRAKSRLYSLGRSWLQVTYHKLWYRRIAPRLPSRFWGPQWRLWLRYDF